MDRPPRPAPKAPNPGSLPYYRTGALLRAKHNRVQHDSARDFPRWALQLVPIAPRWRVLDAGCGWGRFVWPLVEQIGVAPGQLVAADLSVGMLHTLRDEAERRGTTVPLCNASLDVLPFAPATFDLVIAAHVLYHLPDLDCGVFELARVLKPDGFLLATTNSEAIKVLVLDLHEQALRLLDLPSVPLGGSSFSLENGAASLGRAFARVTTHFFEDATTWPDVETFVGDYRTIGRYRMIVEDESLPRDKRARLAEEVCRLAAEVLAREGALRSPVLMGAFVCSKPIAAQNR